MQLKNASKTFLDIAFCLVVIHLIVVVLYFGDYFGDGVKYWHISVFDLDEEESFGTWFSAIILLYAGRLLYGRYKDEQGNSSRFAWGWLVLAIGFHVLSIDEVAGMHELLNSVLKEMNWTEVAMIGVLITGVAFIPFLRSLDTRELLWFVIAGCVYIAGAVGVEWATEGYAREGQLNTVAYNLWTCLEEGLEMLGVVLFVHALEKKSNL